MEASVGAPPDLLNQSEIKDNKDTCLSEKLKKI